MAWLSFFLLVWNEPPPSLLLGLNPSRAETRTLRGIDSPTGMLRVGTHFFLTADILSPHPGLYRLVAASTSELHATPVAILPQQDLQGLTLDSEQNFLLSSSRLLRAYPSDWVSQIVKLEPDRYLKLETFNPQIPNRCRSGTFECGLVESLAPFPNVRVLVTRQKPAKVFLFRRSKGNWRLSHSFSLKMGRRPLVVSEVKQKGDAVLFLIQDQWLLAGVRLQTLLAQRGPNLQLTPWFNFSLQKKSFQLSSLKMYYRGIPQAFDFDSVGSLWVVLNNRGHMFRITPDNQQNRHPRLLIFKKSNIRVQH